MRKKAKGSTKNGWQRQTMLQISVYFDRETFDEISALAARGGQTFAQTVRNLVEWGLEDSKQNPVGNAGGP